MVRKGLIALIFLLLPALAPAQSYQIGTVSIEGNRRVEESTIRSVLSTNAGGEVSIEQIDRDIRAIYKMGRFEDVEAEIETRDGAQVLVFRLTERPLVRTIRFDGNDELDESKLRDLVSLKAPGLYDPKEVADSVKAIKKAYAEEGYYAAEVNPEVEVNDRSEATVTFKIDEGEKVLIDEIRFEGNTIFSDRELKKVMGTKEKWFLSWITGRGAYQEDVLANDLEIIADQYYNRGYVQIKVRQPRIVLNEDKSSMDIVIEIDEGQQFRVGEVDVTGDLIESREKLLELIKLEPGEVFSRKRLREDVFAVHDLYADRGYAYVNVSPLTRLDLEKRLINLKFDIEKGVQVSIEKIRINGNTKTRDKVIRREMKLVEGDLYSSTKLKESRRRVNNLGFFEEVDVTSAKGSDEEHMDIDVGVKEKPTGTFSVGFGYSSVDGFIGQGSVSQDNFLGRALKLNLAGSLGGSSTTYQFGLTNPYFLDTNLTLGFDLYKTERDYVDFSKKATGGDLKLGFPLSDYVRTFFIYRYEKKEIFDIDEDNASLVILDQEGLSTLSSISASLTRNTTDYHLDPSKGSVSQLSIEYAGLGGTEKFAKYIADHRQFYPWKWGTVFSLHGQVGYIQKVGGEEIPLDERFFLGGLSTIRGFNSREVGPRDPDTGDFIGGEKEAFFNFEYTFPISKDLGLKGVLFFDTGNAWGEDEDFFSEMRYSAGGGIRWFSPMGPLRLEWGYNLDPREDEDPSQFEFSIGKFF